VNSGVSSFSPANAGDLIRSSYALKVHSEATSGTQVIDSNLLVLTERELQDGTIIMNAPGVIDSFSTPALGAPSRRFVSDVNFGWQPSAQSGGLVLSPATFGRVFAKRPTSITIRPDGKRALISYFQTGNFGVLDVEAAEQFSNPEASVFATPGLFSGVVGVTPAVRLGKDLVPLNAEDKRLLYPLQIEYSQSGRFAAAIHDAAVSFINDGAINEDLLTHASARPLRNGVPRPYYSQFPICAVPPAPERNVCEQDVTTTLYEYRAAIGGTQSFVNPKAIAIGPVLELTEPRFGDRITGTTEIHVRWKDTGISSIHVEVFDITAFGGASGPDLGSRTRNVTPANKSVTFEFESVLRSPNVPVPGKRYRIVVSARSAAGNELSKTSADILIR
jgi:hypothetical protein